MHVFAIPAAPPAPVVQELPTAPPAAAQLLNLPVVGVQAFGGGVPELQAFGEQLTVAHARAVGPTANSATPVAS